MDLLGIIENAAAMAGYKILEGDHDTLYVKDHDNNVFEIKVAEVAD